MRKDMTTKQFIISCIINVLNSIFYFFSYKVTFNYKGLIYLTILTLDFNCIYLFLSFICDISFFIFKSERLEKLNDFLRNKFCHVFNPLSYLVTILFWSLAAMGGMGDIFINFQFIVICTFNNYNFCYNRYIFCRSSKTFFFIEIFNCDVWICFILWYFLCNINFKI